jgi:hypothetical protein
MRQCYRAITRRQAPKAQAANVQRRPLHRCDRFASEGAFLAKPLDLPAAAQQRETFRELVRAIRRQPGRIAAR